jgi:hypothetical protein
MHGPGGGTNNEHVADYPGAFAPLLLPLLHDFPDPGRFHRFPGSSPPSDTSNPMAARFRAGRDITRTQAPRQCRAAGDFLPPSGEDLRFGPGLACFSGDGRDASSGACIEGSGGLVPGKGDPVLAQVPDRSFRADRGPDVGSAASAPPPLSGGFCSGQQQGQGGQARQDAVLADIAFPGRPASRKIGSPAAVIASDAYSSGDGPVGAGWRRAHEVMDNGSAVKIAPDAWNPNSHFTAVL